MYAPLMRIRDREAWYWNQVLLPLQQATEDALSAVLPDGITVHMDGKRRCGICDAEGHDAEECGVW